MPTMHAALSSVRNMFLVALAFVGGCQPKQTSPSTSAVEGDTKKPVLRPSVANAPADVAPIQFLDVTDRSGIDFRHQNSRTPRKYMIETTGSGGAFCDFDRDGWQDIILINNTLLPGGKVEGRPTLKLYRNRGAKRTGDGVLLPTFEDVTHRAGLDKESFYGMGVAVGDYDNDGWEDFYVTGVLGRSRLFHNELGKNRVSGVGYRVSENPNTKNQSPTPYFREVAVGAGVTNADQWGTSCAWLDYDNDGKLDLFVCNYVTYRSLKDDRPCFAGQKRVYIYCAPNNYESVRCVLYRNAGNGKFRDVSKEAGIATKDTPGKSLGVSVWDYDSDGLLDIFVANDTVPGFLFHNEGGGKFTDVGVESGVGYDDDGAAHSGMGIDAADVWNNGKTSLTITNFQGQQTSFYNQDTPDVFHDDRMNAGIGQATAPVLGFGVFFCDFDLDGWKDLLQVNGHVQDDIQTREPETTYKQPTLLFRNRGDGTFEETGQRVGAPFTKPIAGRGCAWGDVNNDGLPDVLITENNGRAMLWLNRTTTQNHWVKLRLVGTRSGRSGIGAIVTVRAGGMTQRFMVRCGSSYLSQSDLRVNVGLGAQTAADIEVRWPSGVTDKITGAVCDQSYLLTEGTSALKAEEEG
jgi:enediyne biosynthesis protein E4